MEDGTQEWKEVLVKCEKANGESLLLTNIEQKRITSPRQDNVLGVSAFKYARGYDPLPSIHSCTARKTCVGVGDQYIHSPPEVRIRQCLPLHCRPPQKRVVQSKTGLEERTSVVLLICSAHGGELP